MARGQITPFIAGKFAAQAVGVTNPDQAGQILAEGVRNIGRAIALREDVTTSMEATARFGEFQLDYETAKRRLYDQFKDNPLEYPQAVKGMSEKLIDKYSVGMPDKLNQKFRRISTASVASDSGATVKTAFNRDNEIQVENILTSYQNIALRGPMTESPEQFADTLDGFDFVSSIARKLIDPKADAELKARYKKTFIKNAMMSQINSSPAKVLRELTGGAYKGVLSPDDVSIYSTKARTAVHNRAEDDLFRSLYLAQGRLLDLTQQIDNRQISISELITEREAAWANRNQKDVNGRNIISPSYIKGLDNLIDQVTFSRLTVKQNVEARKASLKKFDRGWEEYLTEKKQEGEVANEEDIDRQIGIYTELSDLFHQGTITKADFDEKVSIMRTKLSLKKGGVTRIKSFTEVIDQAGTVQWGWWRREGGDVVSLGYQMIKEYVDKAYSTSSEEDIRDLKTRMLSQYHQAIQNTPEETFSDLTTKAERSAFAKDLVFGKATESGTRSPGVVSRNMSFLDAKTNRRLYAGDTLSQFGVEKMFVGLNPETGRAIWKLPPESRDKVIKLPNGRVYTVVDIDSISGEFQLRPVQDAR